MLTSISIQVEFHATIQKVFGEKSTWITQSSPLTVRRLLDVLCTSHERHEKIFDDAGQLQTGVTVLKNGRNIVFLEGLNTELKNGDKIALFPPVTGG
jgi:molybdopterin synthase sulfur carrier subunit